LHLASANTFFFTTVCPQPPCHGWPHTRGLSPTRAPAQDSVWQPACDAICQKASPQVAVCRSTLVHGEPQRERALSSPDRSMHQAGRATTNGCKLSVTYADGNTRGCMWRRRAEVCTCKETGGPAHPPGRSRPAIGPRPCPHAPCKSSGKVGDKRCKSSRLRSGASLGGGLGDSGRRVLSRTPAARSLRQTDWGAPCGTSKTGGLEQCRNWLKAQHGPCWRQGRCSIRSSPEARSLPAVVLDWAQHPGSLCATDRGMLDMLRLAAKAATDVKGASGDSAVSPPGPVRIGRAHRHA
jgi:hypothetical protein